MSHHGNEHPDPAFIQKLLRETRAQHEGEFPNGRLNGNDAGAIALGIGVEKDAVVLRFAKPVEWIGFTPEQAVELAQSLIQRAREANRSSGKPLTVSL
jgi:hypothetical protein